jgi:hypothetical protein
MSRTRTEYTHAKSLGRRVGEETKGWRCPECTFHNTGDACTMCQQPKPKVTKQIKSNKPGKPQYSDKKPQKEELKSEVYYDRTDGSFNVPIAGIKKYDHKPGKNIVTLNSLQASPPQPKKNPSNIVTLDSIQSKPVQKKIDGKRDLLGMLQDASSDDPLPCMRKPAKNSVKK